MRKVILVLAGIFMTGCATTHRYSYREVREYGEVLDVAKKTHEAGLISDDVMAKMRQHYTDMIVSYGQHPGEDALEKAAREIAQAQQVQAFSSAMSIPQPAPYQPPMSPSEFSNVSSQWHHLAK